MLKQKLLEFEIFIQSSAGKADESIAQDLNVEISHVKNFKSKIAKKNKDVSNVKDITKKVNDMMKLNDLPNF